jgi:hypothetical protein
LPADGTVTRTLPEVVCDPLESADGGASDEGDVVGEVDVVGDDVPPPPHANNRADANKGAMKVAGLNFMVIIYFLSGEANWRMADSAFCRGWSHGKNVISSHRVARK